MVTGTEHGLQIWLPEQIYFWQAAVAHEGYHGDDGHPEHHIHMYSMFFFQSSSWWCSNPLHHHCPESPSLGCCTASHHAMAVCLKQGL